MPLKLGMSRIFLWLSQTKVVWDKSTFYGMVLVEKSMAVYEEFLIFVALEAHRYSQKKTLHLNSASTSRSSRNFGVEVRVVIIQEALKTNLPWSLMTSVALNGFCRYRPQLENATWKYRKLEHEDMLHPLYLFEKWGQLIANRPYGPTWLVKLVAR